MKGSLQLFFHIKRSMLRAKIVILNFGEGVIYALFLI
jgi:hypothetical protein